MTLVEALSLRGGGATWPHALGIAAGTSLWVFAVALGVAGVAGAFAQAAIAGEWLSRNPWKRLGAALVALPLGGYALYAGALAAHRYLVAPGVRAIALAWLGVLLGAGLWTAGVLVGRLLETRLRARPGPRAVVAGTVALSVGWACSFFVLEPEVYRGIGGHEWLPFFVAVPVTAATGLFVATRPQPARRMAGLIGGALGILLVALAAVGWFLPRPDNLSDLIEQHSQTTRLVHGFFQRFGDVPAPVTTAGSAFGGSCFPEHSPPAPGLLPRASAGAPDILLVMVDAMRWDHTTLAGYRQDTTPNLARFASRMAIFERAYVSGASTRQTFRSLLTGILPSQVKPSRAQNKWGLSFPEHQETLASYMRAAGYETISIQRSKVFTDEESRATHGFDQLDVAPMDAFPERKFAADSHIDRVIAHLSEHPRSRPQFVFTHLMELHQPFRPGPGARVFGRGRAGKYDSAMHSVDRELGRLLRFVTSPMRRDRTVLIIAADHGMGGLGGRGGMPQHGRSLYDDQIHVPLLFLGKGIRANRFEAPVSVLDIFPTVLDLAGIDPFSSLCGKSLKAVVTGTAKLEPRPVVTEILPDHAGDTFRIAYIEKNYKLMVDVRSGTRWLFDLKKDPKEKEDLAGDHPKEVREYEARLRRYLEERGHDPSEFGL